MGLFGKEKATVTCDICGKETGTKENKKHKAKNGVVCNDCFLAAGLFPGASSSAIPLEVFLEQIGSTDGANIMERTMKHVKEESLASAMAKVKADAKNVPQSITDIPSSASSSIKCPKCGSDQISANQKGFGVGKAVVGAAIAGPLGLIGGNIGAKKVRVTCLKCGHHWEAGKAK